MRYMGSLATETVNICEKSLSAREMLWLFDAGRNPVEAEPKSGRRRIKKNDAIKLYGFIMKTPILALLKVVKRKGYRLSMV
jgi:hypothetical protein